MLTAIVLTEAQEQEFNTPILQNFAKAYLKFQHSSPVTTNRKLFRYFEPLPVEKLNDDDILYGPNRDEAYKELIFLFRLCVMSGQFTPFFKDKNLYWQSKTMPNLVIMKKWIKISAK